jgi:hypothetical protein
VAVSRFRFPDIPPWSDNSLTTEYVEKAFMRGLESPSLRVEFLKEVSMIGLTQIVDESFARHGSPVDLAVSRIVSGREQQPSADAATEGASSNKKAQIGRPAPLPSGF